MMKAVPSVGCPANGTSDCGVKIRTSNPPPLSSSFRMNVVSEKFISRAIFCMSVSESDSAWRMTASSFPAYLSSAKTSTMERGWKPMLVLTQAGWHDFGADRIRKMRADLAAGPDPGRLLFAHRLAATEENVLLGAAAL